MGKHEFGADSLVSQLSTKDSLRKIRNPKHEIRLPRRSPFLAKAGNKFKLPKERNELNGKEGPRMTQMDANGRAQRRDGVWEWWRNAAPVQDLSTLNQRLSTPEGKSQIPGSKSQVKPKGNPGKFEIRSTKSETNSNYRKREMS